MSFFSNENFRRALELFLQRLPDAALVTLYVTLGAIAIGMSVGLLLALARLSPERRLARLAESTTSVLRTIPVPPFLYLKRFTERLNRNSLERRGAM